MDSKVEVSNNSQSYPFPPQSPPFRFLIKAVLITVSGDTKGTKICTTSILEFQIDSQAFTFRGSLFLFYRFFVELSRNICTSPNRRVTLRNDTDDSCEEKINHKLTCCPREQNPLRKSSHTSAFLLTFTWEYGQLSLEHLPRRKNWQTGIWNLLKH